jgi:hypothetical protein
MTDRPLLARAAPLLCLALFACGSSSATPNPDGGGAGAAGGAAGNGGAAGTTGTAGAAGGTAGSPPGAGGGAGSPTSTASGRRLGVAPRGVALVKNDGTGVVWNPNFPHSAAVTVANLSTATAVALNPAGAMFFVLADGTVSSAGFTMSTSTAAPVAGLSDVAGFTSNGPVSIAIKKDGTASYGASSTGGFVPLPGLTNVDSVAVAGTSSAATLVCAVLKDGTVTCSQFDGTSTPGPFVPVAGLTGVREIAITGTSEIACARLADGTVDCWGSKYAKVNSMQTPSVPTPVPGIAGAVGIAAGEEAACALLADGTVTCWGGNGSGELGITPDGTAHAPTTIMGVSGATLIAAGRGAVGALTAGGVMFWGGTANSGPTMPVTFP